MGAKLKRNRGGHEIYFHKNLPRSIPIQSHIDPVPEFIVINVLKQFNITINEMWEIIKPSKGTTQRKSKTTKRGKRSINEI